MSNENLIEENPATEIFKSKPKKNIPVPELPFEKFCSQEEDGEFKYKNIDEIMETKEWKEIYSNYYSFEDEERSIELNVSLEELESYDTHRQMQEIIKCTNSFSYFCIKYARINHPIFGPINFIPYQYQKRVVDCYSKKRFNILSKFRQGGLTTVSVIWALWRCLFKTGQRIMVVSKTDREAIAAGSVAKTVVDWLPSWLKPETDKFNEHEKEFKTTSSVLWSYTVEAARGKSITVLIVDEAAFIDGMHEAWKAIYPVIATGGSCEVVSTVNGMGNWYEEIYHDAEAGKNIFNVIELDYWEHPLYNDPKWIADTKANLTEKAWQQEIERSFLSSGDKWITGSVMERLIISTTDNSPLRMSFSKWRNKGSDRRNSWDDGALWIWREPINGHDYIIGADCAEGVGETGDNSCFQIIDSVTLEQVAEFYSNTVPPYIFAQILREIGYFYNTALIVVENASQGSAVLTTLESDLLYENLYYENNKQSSCGLKSTKSKRPQILQCLQQKLLNGTLKVNSCRFVQELHTFIFNPITKKPQAQRGKHDDAIMAFSFALYARDEQSRGMPIGAEVPEEALQIFKSEVYEEIKNEILNSDHFEDFLNEPEEEKPFWLSDNYIITNKTTRKADAVLKEFGW